MIDLKDLQTKTIELVNKNAGEIIEFKNETKFTERGERYHIVKFEGALARIQNSFAAMVDFYLPIDEANRMAELYIRRIGIANVPTLTVLEELELQQLEKKFEVTQNDFEKRLSSVDFEMRT